MTRAVRPITCVWLIAALALAPSCTSSKVSTSTGATTSSSSPLQDVPSLDAPLPTSADALALRLQQTTTSLDAAINGWIASGTTDTWPPPDDIVYLAIDQQRIYQALVSSTRLREAVLALLPSELRVQAADTADAGAALIANVAPHRGPIDIKTRPPLPAATLLGYYREAQQRFGVSWEILAAVNFVETRFGRVVSPSWAAARGPMQFLRPTWAAYGLGGDVRDPHDAIIGAANYLHAAGAPEDYRQALHAYNPVKTYIDAVQRYARTMRRDSHMFYAYYNWQVFVLTRSGSVRISGPGV